MRTTDLNVTERAVVEAFSTGRVVDARGRQDVVRAAVIRWLLVGGGAAVEPGSLPRLHLVGASVTGELDLAHADITVPVTLEDCRFDRPVDFFGSRLRRLSLAGSTMPGLLVGNAILDATLRLVNCRSSAPVGLGNTQIAGALLLNGAKLAGLDCNALRTTGDVVARDGFTCRGEFRLDNAEIGGSLHFEGAVIEALAAADLRVGAVAHLCEGFTGAAHLGHATITNKVCFEGAVLNGSTVDCRHLTTRELALLPARPPEGLVDLGHARIGLLRDDPATWAPALRLDGLTYESLPEPHDRAARLRWLRLDRQGFRPQTYTQLAQVYRSTGRDDDARAILLAGERHRRESLTWPGRLWGHLQDLTIGYGYQPIRAAAWLGALLVLGTTVFGLYPPRPVAPGTGPAFDAFTYTMDLILPGVDFGQQAAFNPRGASSWLAYILIIAGLVLVTTIAAAGARRLRRD